MELTDSNFKKTLEAKNARGPRPREEPLFARQKHVMTKAFVFFQAPWCGTSLRTAAKTVSDW